MTIAISYHVNCDVCEVPLTDPDGSVGHYATTDLAEAAAEAAGWTRPAANGRRGIVELCPACTPHGAPGGPIVHRLIQPPRNSEFACLCGALWSPGRVRGVSASRLARCPRVRDEENGGESW